MPLKICDHSVSVMFFNPGIGKLGSSPTRLGEILACGKPVIANAGVGDVAKILKENNVGILIDNDNSLAIGNSVDSISRLLKDDTLSLRCRKVAENIFSLSDGSKKFKSIYKGILSSQIT
jgi:glycosyltransferase involved in cell wall biosynthesis